MQFKFIVAAVLSLASIAQGVAAIPHGASDVFVPKILDPRSPTTWTVGNVEAVKSDTPSGSSNNSNLVTIIINLQELSNLISNILQGLHIRDESANTAVKAGLYRITLLGGSGNTNILLQIV